VPHPNEWVWRNGLDTFQTGGVCAFGDLPRGFRNADERLD